MNKNKTFEENLSYLNQYGFLLVKNALSTDLIITWQKILYSLYQEKKHEIDNSVVNVAFEKLLELEPEMPRDLIAHGSEHLT